MVVDLAKKAWLLTFDARIFTKFILIVNGFFTSFTKKNEQFNLLAF